MLLVATLLGAVALRHAFTSEVPNVRLDGAVVLALALVRHANVGATGFAFVAIGLPIDAAHRGVDLGATAALTYAFVQRASQDAFLADPAHRTIEVTVADAVLRDALAGLADVPRSTIDQRAQIHAHPGRRWLGDTRVYSIDGPAVERLTIMSGRAIAVVAAHPLAKALEAFDELVRRRETALPVLLPLARGLLIALVDGTPLARARDVHPSFYAQVVATARAHAAIAGRLFAVALVPNANAGTRGLAGVDVVAAVTAAHRFKDARAIAASGTRDAPVRIRPGHARVANEAILGCSTVHGLVAAATVGNVMLAASRVLDRIGLPVFAADEPLEGGGSAATGFTAARNRHPDGADNYPSQPKSLHCFSPRTWFWPFL
jgi:hypothetical protein